MESIFTQPILRRESFRRVVYGGIQYGYSFQFSPADTRGTYLSCLEAFRVELDGEPVNPRDMTIRVSAGEFSVAQMPELASTVLGLGETATIKVRHYGDLSGKHTLRLSYNGRLPFIGSTGHTLAPPCGDEMNVEV